MLLRCRGSISSLSLFFFFFLSLPPLFSVLFLFPVKRQLPVRQRGQTARDPTYLPAEFCTLQSNINFVLAPLAVPELPPLPPGGLAGKKGGSHDK